ncbi:MAG: hypothetical protein KZQ95_11110 [Candidatus Thiodiazotropha sp. (ex Epidulcina cf. delphinae)]|nr:hypothetical protein [Candidatus Thiodiazotropha sp. (ex Epidulcina cf. delphinae)]
MGVAHSSRLKKVIRRDNGGISVFQGVPERLELVMLNWCPGSAVEMERAIPNASLGKA